MENSKSEILHWINTLLKTNFTKIEQLGNGVAYCKLLNLIDPTCLNSTKIVLKTKTQIDHISNLKLFQTAMQKLHMKKQFDIDKVSKCYFHENYDLALFLKKQHSLRFSSINKENTSINNSIIYENHPNILEEQQTSDDNLLTQIASIMQSVDSAETKVLQTINLLKTHNFIKNNPQFIDNKPLYDTTNNIFNMFNNQNVFNKDNLFKTDSKKQQSLEQNNNLLCETPEMLLDPHQNNEDIFDHQSSSKLIMKIQSQSKIQQEIKKETPNFCESPFIQQPQQNSLADFIKSESKQQQQYMQQYSLQKQLQMQNQINTNPPQEYQSPFREQIIQLSSQKEIFNQITNPQVFSSCQKETSQNNSVFYSCKDKGAIIEE
ncbi:unnamed protein product (macronuclear) [Paramecium tetraurelia]|uniref:Calponin-homology (CH) domain-containing protein n=1 Tax=Paramecium tetraurelia TaxID=5888 RepID=A0BJK2_PARTE|nr:uncharacterized protein GSPATT00029347001 [Paramecium tetraurelia]CAK58719.1 unnamed protein product [Paramecium tetraurelia]|eukprot:XP_001426117.1 hypothetical protein (macronuclear) [Paramecium tetraurelia strain d4-2]